MIFSTGKRYKLSAIHRFESQIKPSSILGFSSKFICWVLSFERDIFIYVLGVSLPSNSGKWRFVGILYWCDNPGADWYSEGGQPNAGVAANPIQVLLGFFLKMLQQEKSRKTSQATKIFTNSTEVSFLHHNKFPAKTTVFSSGKRPKGFKLEKTEKLRGESNIVIGI